MAARGNAGASTHPVGRQAESVVARQIRDAILEGEFVSGQRLIEAELCERYGVGRGPVRAALIELDHEGLVERVAHRGARVRIVSIDEAVELTEVRMVVEGLIAAKAAERVTAKQISDLREIGALMQTAVTAGDVLAYGTLNVELHALIGAIADHSVAAHTLGTLRGRNVKHQFRMSLRPGRVQATLPEHLAIIDEICARSPEGAERAMRRHVASVVTALRATE